MIYQFPLERRDVELLIGGHKAFAARNLDACSQMLKENKPLVAIGKAFDDAGEHLRQVEHWTEMLAKMDQPNPDATEGELENGLP